MQYLLLHPFISIVAGFGLAALILGWFVFDLRRKWKTVFGRRPQSGGGAVGEALERIVTAERRLGALEPRLETLEAISRIAVQKMGFLRFNPFSDTGGDQSFAVALLDHEDNGIVISSLYTREGVRIYAKEVRGGTSKHPLSEEEEAVLAQAMAPGLPRE